jgi:hypothetical protein
VERKAFGAIRWAIIGVALALCFLAYLHRVPLVFGMAATCVFPLIWAVDAYRAEKRLKFAASAALVLVTALPLLHMLR